MWWWGGPEGPYRGVGLKVLGLRFEFFSNWICIYDPNILYLSGRKNSWMHYVVVGGPVRSYWWLRIVGPGLGF